RLGCPHGVIPEAVRLLRQGDAADRIVVPELQTKTHRAILLSMSGALFPPAFLERRTCYRAFMEEHVYPNEQALELEDDGSPALIAELQAQARAAGLWAPHMP